MYKKNILLKGPDDYMHQFCRNDLTLLVPTQHIIFSVPRRSNHCATCYCTITIWLCAYCNCCQPGGQIFKSSLRPEFFQWPGLQCESSLKWVPENIMGSKDTILTTSSAMSQLIYTKILGQNHTSNMFHEM